MLIEIMLMVRRSVINYIAKNLTYYNQKFINLTIMLFITVKLSVSQLLEFSKYNY